MGAARIAALAADTPGAHARIALPAPLPTYDLYEAPPEDAAARVDAGLGAFNDASAPLHQVRSLCAIARESGVVVGGALGRTWGSACELQQLWVESAMRRHGIGRELVRRFEAEAIARGCTSAYLYTFSFQAPAFYRAQGYAVAHTLRGFPDGIEKHLMTKALAPRALASPSLTEPP